MTKRPDDLFDRLPIEEDEENTGIDEDAVEAQALAEWEAEDPFKEARRRISNTIFLSEKITK